MKANRKWDFVALVWIVCTVFALFLAASALCGEIEQVTAYRTEDGKLWGSEAGAEKHEFKQEIDAFLADLAKNDSELRFYHGYVVRMIEKYHKELLQFLQDGVGAESCYKKRECSKCGSIVYVKGGDYGTCPRCCGVQTLNVPQAE